MSQRLQFPHERLPAKAEALRHEVRAFLREELATGHFVPSSDSWMNASPAFSRKLGAAGWLGMTWPRQYGGAERSSLERYVVTEELLSAGAPVGAHWIADRQTGPMLLRYGTEEQRLRFLPAIARGECYFAIGMSEPDAGSDLAAVRTRADRTDGGWRLNGRKIWSSFAHEAHCMIVLSRTSPKEENRHAGLSQLMVELDSPRIQMRPILNLTGHHHFNEVVFDEVFVPDTRVVGEIGAGWKQVVSELAYERSGPERFLSFYPVLASLLGRLAAQPGAPDGPLTTAVGALVAQLETLRQMSLSVAGRLQAGASPEIEAAVVIGHGANLAGEPRDALDLARSSSSIDTASSIDELPWLARGALQRSAAWRWRPRMCWSASSSAARSRPSRRSSSSWPCWRRKWRRWTLQWMRRPTRPSTPGTSATPCSISRWPRRAPAWRWNRRRGSLTRCTAPWVSPTNTACTLAYRGPNVFPGCFKQPEANARSFDADGFFYTGDTFKILEGNFLSFFDRKKDIIIRGGFNISAAEVENMALGHPAIVDCAAIAVPDEIMGEKVCLCAVARDPQRPPTLDQITGWMREQGFGSYKLPESLRMVEAIPRNPAGKIVKRELRESA